MQNECRVTQMLMGNKQLTCGRSFASWVFPETCCSCKGWGQQLHQHPAAARAPCHTWPSCPDRLYQGLLKTLAQGIPERDVPLRGVAVPLPLPAPVGRVVPLQLLRRNVVGAHPPVRRGRSQVPLATLGNGVVFPHPSLVVIARLAVDLENPWGRQHKQGKQLLLKIPGTSCFPRRACEMAEIGMWAVYRECLCREPGCHRLRLKGVVTETSEEWHNKVLHKNHLGKLFYTHYNQLIRCKETNEITIVLPSQVK